MQRALISTAGAIVLIALAVTTAGCNAAPPAAGATSNAAPTVSAATRTSPSAVTQAAAMDTDVFIQVLRRYLSTPGENSFPGLFKTVYVLDQAFPGAADPMGKHGHGRGVPIAPQTQQQVTAALAGLTHVIFIANRESVIQGGGCGVVKNGGILITLGQPSSQGRELRVGINGFVACAGATWLTYILRNQPGVGWRVTGTTGTMAIA